jgi:hypothetical protein
VTEQEECTHAVRIVRDGQISTHSSCYPLAKRQSKRGELQATIGRRQENSTSMSPLLRAPQVILDATLAIL